MVLTSAKGSSAQGFDSLFLAFPLAFKDRVVQYIGRILRTNGTVSQKSVGSEVWAAALVVHGHYDELPVGHSVAHGIREPSGGDPSLDDFTVVVVDCWCSGVRPARSPYDRRADGHHEPIA